MITIQTLNSITGGNLNGIFLEKKERGKNFIR